MKLPDKDGEELIWSFLSLQKWIHFNVTFELAFDTENYQFLQKVQKWIRKTILCFHRRRKMNLYEIESFFLKWIFFSMLIC